MDAPTLLRHVQYRVPDHEAVLSFVNDEDAEFFEEWWNRDGLALYTRWVDSRRSGNERWGY